MTDAELLEDGATLPEDAEGASIEPKTCVTFELAGQVFAVDVANVREILDPQPIARLPNAPGDVLGMIDVRGEGVAVVDLPARLGLLPEGAAAHARILVFELDDGCGGRAPLGVVADRVLRVVDISDNDVEPAPNALGRWDGSAVVGVARIDGRLTMLLALERLFGTGVSSEFAFA